MATAQEPMKFDEHPAVVAALQVLEPIRAERARLEAERAEAWRLSGAAPTRSDDALVFARPEEMVGAQLRLDEIGRDLLRVRVREAPAERELVEATELAKQEIGAVFDERRRALVKKLDSALSRTAAINDELHALDNEVVAVLGNAQQRFAWHELLPETPSAETRIARWRRSAHEHGLLDSD